MSTYQDDNGRWRATCTCPWRCREKFLMRWQAEDMLITHRETVERARAHLQARGTLLGDYKWAVEQAQNPENSAEDRILWQQLADGYRTRLGTTPEEDALF